jgi:hypothetical protein
MADESEVACNLDHCAEAVFIKAELAKLPNCDLHVIRSTIPGQIAVISSFLCGRHAAEVSGAAVSP